MLALGAFAVDTAFRRLLVDQATLQIAQTADDMERVAQAAANVAFPDVSPQIVLSNRSTLDHWASSNAYVQIDDLDGEVLGKSTNLGNLIFQALPAGERSRRTILRSVGDPPGDFIVLDRMLVDTAGHPIAVAHVGQRLNIVQALIARARIILLWVTFGAIVAIVIASFIVASLVTGPIVRLTAAVAEIGSARLDLRLRWRRSDELGRLANAFDAMLDRLQSAFARERQFISDASHELRTPLTVISANARMLRRWGADDPTVRDESIDAIADESERLAAMVSGMLTLSKAESGDDVPKEPLVLERLVDAVVANSVERAAAKGTNVRAHHAEDASTIVIGEDRLLRQMIGNLVDNAIKFTDHGTIDVSVGRDGALAVIEVADSGIGLGDADTERLFDRFFRGDPSHAREIEGTGLGLAIVRSIARVHGGSVAAAVRPGGGSLFTVRLPAEPESFTGIS